MYVNNMYVMYHDATREELSRIKILLQQLILQKTRLIQLPIIKYKLDSGDIIERCLLTV